MDNRDGIVNGCRYDRITTGGGRSGSHVSMLKNALNERIGRMKEGNMNGICLTKTNKKLKSDIDLIILEL